MKLLVTYKFQTRAGVTYHAGDKLEIIDKTKHSPYGPLPTDLFNWLVKCNHFEPPMDESVWAVNAINSLFLQDLVVVHYNYNTFWNTVNL